MSISDIDRPERGADAHSADALIDLHARHHRLIDTAEMAGAPEERVIALMFRAAYEHAATLITAGPVLDLGCNTGYGTAILRDRTGSNVIGVDVSPGAIDAARRQWGGEFQVVDGKRLPFEDGWFAAITCFQVIEHIDPVEPFLAEIRRVLRPGGTVLFTTPNAATRIDPGERPWNRYHVREYRAVELAATLRNFFSDVRVQGLFGPAELEAFERERVARLRRIGKIRNRVAFLLPVPVEDKLIRTAKRILAMLRPARRVDAEQGVIDRFTPGDLRYSVEDVDHALDLMAVCRR